MSNSYLNTVYQQFIYKSRYSKYIEKEKRRESWEETVDRYFSFMEEHLKDRCNFDLKKARKELEEAVLSLKIMPSMRGLMTAGVALRRDESALYNCAYLPIDNLRSFDEHMYCLMLGTGVGFSVEQGYVGDLPIIADTFHKTDTVIIFEDSRIGWAKGYKEYVSLLVNGMIPKYDTSKLRPAGARLKTFGGRASGPQPLIELLEFTQQTFLKAAGRRLTTLEAHDIACKIADIVVVGGVRRSACISLSDLGDDRMRSAKSGEWWTHTGYRRLANNSAVYNEKPDIGIFMKEWISLYESKSGERGIFSRPAVHKIVEHSNNLRKEWYGDKVRLRDSDYDFGCNPCSEIILRPYEFCNLTSVQIRETDTLETLVEKVKLATILGTIQSTFTHFKYLNKKWQRNCEDERLLGVSLNGVYDNEITNGRAGESVLIDVLTTLRRTAIETNLEWAKKLGIPSSVAITAIKPEGTTSALNLTSSGIHPAFEPFYIRYVRNDIKDPITKFMQEAGIPWEVDEYDPNNMVVFKFPLRSSKNAKFARNISAIEHLKLWKLYQIYYCEHKPSVTIQVREHEWLEVGAWVYENFDWMSGVSFLPYDDHVYKQAPFTRCSEEEFNKLEEQMPKSVDWEQLAFYELEDSTTNIQTLACTGPEGCFV